jgi:hypothetical protein
MAAGQGGFSHVKVICARGFVESNDAKKITAFGSSYGGRIPMQELPKAAIF